MSSEALAVDTSVTVPLVLASHAQHQQVVDALRGHDLHISGHALAETYSVLTRLPGDARLAPTDAVSVIATNFGDPISLPHDVHAALPRTLADVGIAGGATYDAMVGLAALHADLELATRDARAASTYRSVGVKVRQVSG